jgi:hypothetical protein
MQPAAVPPATTTPFGAATNVFMSFGITSTPKPGWECCNTAPSHCSLCGGGRPIYFSDVEKTWGEEGLAQQKCSGWTVKNARVARGGTAYDYEFSQPLCGNGVLTVTRGGIAVGQLNNYSHCCPCDKTIVDAVDATGKSQYSQRNPPFTCCCGMKKREGCKLCGGGGKCCDSWALYDIMFVSAPEPQPREPFLGRITTKHHMIAPAWYPAWTGFVEAPTTDEDLRALLLGFIFISNQLEAHRSETSRDLPLPSTVRKLLPCLF